MRKKSGANLEKARLRNQSDKNKMACRKRKANDRRIKSDAKRAKLGSVAIMNHINSFHKAIEDGPFYICCVCNRTLYRRTVKIFYKSMYENFDEQAVFTNVKSFDDVIYICFTCHNHIRNSKIPPQAVWNILEVFELPPEIYNLKRLEKLLISKRILFKKIAVMSKGQQQKIKGAVCNVPIQAEEIYNCLPQSMDSNGLIWVKLKRKLEYRGHVVFEGVDPNSIKCALDFLKEHNSFYSDIIINMNNITPELLCLSDTDAMIEKDNFSITIEIDSELEDKNPLSERCANADEMCVIPNFFNPDDGLLNIAPAENQKPMAFFSDQFCEELAFPYLFPTGKFGHKAGRPIQLTPTKYFNQRLLNYTQRFSSNADYIFFAHYILQQTNLFNQIHIATKKVKGNITAGQLQTNFNQTINTFLCEDQGYTFMNSIKGTPAYWKKFLYDVLAMVKQLGLPTYFLTPSCADLRWDELVLIIAKLNNIPVDEAMLADYKKRCEILNSNPVLTARHFQYRVETFFKEILGENSPLGKLINFVIKTEFQFRGSPHIHAVLWIENPSILSDNNIDDYVLFIERTIRADLPDSNEEPKLYELVSAYQMHAHSDSCRKYKNIPCSRGGSRLYTRG